MTGKRRKTPKNAGKHLKSAGKHNKKLFFVCFIILIIIYMISNDITISLNELFKYFDTVNVISFRRETRPAFFGTSI